MHACNTLWSPFGHLGAESCTFTAHLQEFQRLTAALDAASAEAERLGEQLAELRLAQEVAPWHAAGPSR